MADLPFQAAIFDLDGTLIDSMEHWKTLGRTFLEPWDITPDEETQRNLERITMREAAFYLKNRFTMDETVEEIYKGLKKTARQIYTEKAPLKAGVEDYLKELKAQNIPMGIATIASKTEAKKVLSRLKIKPYFSCLLTDRDVGKGKSSPDIYLAVAKKLKTPPARCAVFEDSFSFGKVAKEAGFLVYAVKDKNNLSTFDAFVDSADGQAPWNCHADR